MRSARAMPNTPLGILPPEPGCCGMETWAIGLLLKSCENNRRQPLRPAELSSAIAVNCWSSVDMGAAPADDWPQWQAHPGCHRVSANRFTPDHTPVRPGSFPRWRGHISDWRNEPAGGTLPGLWTFERQVHWRRGHADASVAHCHVGSDRGSPRRRARNWGIRRPCRAPDGAAAAGHILDELASVAERFKPHFTTQHQLSG